MHKKGIINKFCSRSRKNSLRILWPHLYTISSPLHFHHNFISLSLSLSSQLLPPPPFSHSTMAAVVPLPAVANTISLQAVDAATQAYVARFNDGLPCRIQFPRPAQRPGAPGPKEHTGWLMKMIFNGKQFEMDVAFEDPLSVEGVKATRLPPHEHEWKFFTLCQFVHTCYVNWDVEGRVGAGKVYTRPAHDSTMVEMEPSTDEKLQVPISMSILLPSVLRKKPCKTSSLVMLASLPCPTKNLHCPVDVDQTLANTSHHPVVKRRTIQGVGGGPRRRAQPVAAVAASAVGSAVVAASAVGAAVVASEAASPSPDVLLHPLPIMPIPLYHPSFFQEVKGDDGDGSVHTSDVIEMGEEDFDAGGDSPPKRILNDVYFTRPHKRQHV